MSRVLANIEFFVFEQEIWIRFMDGSMIPLKETDYDIINELDAYISTFYPKAHSALLSEYNVCAGNPPYYRFRMVARFIRCNFSALDSMPDIDSSMHCNFEQINCPLRGECKFDHVICRPEFDHRLSPAEMRVMSLVYDGLTESAISERLRLSPLTVHTHVRNAYSRIGIHSKSEFVKYATQNNLFT